jgi:SagB-type dehydrogenase family enzyme
MGSKALEGKLDIVYLAELQYSLSMRLELPKEVAFAGPSIDQAIEKRRSERDFTGKPISLLDLSRLLYYANGITDRRQQLRAAPSAGALYPIELYLAINSIEGLNRGIYHYSPQDHCLTLIREGDFRHLMMEHALRQEMLAQASVVFALSAISRRSEWRYRERTHRYIFMEAGHIAQNIYLVASSLGLGSCAVGAFDDDGFNKIIGVDGKSETVIYLMVVGKI